MTFLSSRTIAVLICIITLIFLSVIYLGTGRWSQTTVVPKRSPPVNVISSATPALKKFDGCLAFDPRIRVRDLFQAYFQILQDPRWIDLRPRYSISYTALHSLLYGADAENIYDAWPNFYRKRFDGSYAHTSLTFKLFKSIVKELRVPMRLVVEIGSFIGKSSSNIGRAIQSYPKWADKTVLLCIDTWLGGLEHWGSEQSLMHLEYGRPTIYDQFIANMVAANLTNTVLPLSTPSLIGAQFLLRQKLFAQVIYLDSAHLQGETLVELELYWTLLQPGGILIGDDWSWTSVRCDVLRFADGIGVRPIVLRNTWYIKKEVELDYI